MVDVPRELEQVKVWPLLGAAAVMEILAGSGIVPASPGVVHAVALPPLDLTYDLSLLLSLATSPLWFAVGLILSITGRALVLSLMLGSVRRWWFALRFELLCLVPAFLSAEISYAGRAILYAAVYWVGVSLAVVSALALAHVPWEKTGRLREALELGLTRGPRVPTVLAYVAGLGALGALLHGDGSSFALAGVFISVALTVITAQRLRSTPAAPAAARSAIVILVALAVAFVVAPSTGSQTGVTASRRAGELFVVAGIDTSSGHGSIYRLRPAQLGFSCATTYYFSYIGPGPGTSRGQATCPIRSGAHYERADTERPLASLERAFRQEVDRLAPPVTVVAHSSGAWVAWAALTGDPKSPVTSLVMLAPLTDPPGYPAPGRDGAGIVGAAGMRLMAGIGNWTGFSRFDPDLPLARQLIASKGAIADLFQRAPDVPTNAVAIPTAFDLALFDDSTAAPFPGALVGCALIESHSAAATSSEAMREADRFLSERAHAGCGPEAGWLASSGSAFDTP